LQETRGNRTQSLTWVYKGLEKETKEVERGEKYVRPNNECEAKISIMGEGKVGAATKRRTVRIKRRFMSLGERCENCGGGSFGSHNLRNKNL